MHTIILAIIVIGGSLLLSVLGLMIIRRRFTPQVLQPHHEVAGYMISIIGTLYAVVLGLVIVDAQGRYQQAQLNEATEANAAADLFVIAGALPQDTRIAIRKNVSQYVDIVLDSEWANMHQLRESGPQPSTIPLRQVWLLMSTYEPKTNREQACYSSMLEKLGTLADSRRFRVVVARSGIPPILWAVLVIGGFLTIAFTYFFGVESARAQAIMVAFVSLSLSMNVLLVVFFGNPYEGDLRIKPAGFTFDRQMFKMIGPTGQD